MATTRPRGDQIATATVTDIQEASANVDGLAGVASLRTLGSGAQQACAGNDSRLSDARVPVFPCVITGTNGATGNFFSVKAFGGSPTLFNVDFAGNVTMHSPLGPTQGGTGLSTATQGDLIYASAADTWAKLAAGVTTQDQVLVTGGTGGAPSWANEAWSYLGTVSASGASSADFFWPSNQIYQEYVVVMSNVSAATGSNTFQALLSGDGSTYDSGANNYTWANVQYLSGNFSGGDTKMQLTGSTTLISTTANQDLSGVFRIFDAGASKYTKCTWQLVSLNGAQARPETGGGNRNSAAANRGVRFKMGSGNLTGEFRLYGVTRA